MYLFEFATVLVVVGGPLVAIAVAAKGGRRVRATVAVALALVAISPLIYGSAMYAAGRRWVPYNVVVACGRPVYMVLDRMPNFSPLLEAFKEYERWCCRAGARHREAATNNL